MGLLDDAAGAITDFAKGALGLGGGGGKKVTLADILEGPYTPNKSNWYKTLPYGFKFTPRDVKSDTIVCYLPLAPENITVKTHFATNIIPTLYGTVEEHSEQRYYDIVLSGTTGFAPKYTAPFKAGASKTPEEAAGITGRKSYVDDKSNVGIDPNLAGGFFQKSIGALNAGLNAINDIAENFTGVEVNSGINPETSGYIAFHNLYKFLLAYKKDAAGLNGNTGYKQHPLQFMNYKDNLSYNVAITTFDLTRSANTPMLYNYTIIMRAYDLKDLAKGEAPGLVNDRLKDLGLAGLEGSAFQKLKQSSNGAKAIAGALSGGLNVLGG